MEISLVTILVLDPDMPGQVHHWLQTDRANLLDSLVDGLNVRLEGLAGGELCPALTALVTDLFLVLTLSVLLMFLSRGEAFLTSFALEPGGMVGVGLLLRVTEENVNTASLQ